MVSGCTLATSRAAAMATSYTKDAEISLMSRTLNGGGSSFVWSNIRGPVGDRKFSLLKMYLDSVICAKQFAHVNRLLSS